MGKSKVGLALIDYLRDREKKVLLLGSDATDPDVYKAHFPHAEDGLVCKEVKLDVSKVGLNWSARPVNFLTILW